MAQGKQMMMLWALVYLIGLLATHYLLLQGSLTESMALWIWFVIVLVSNYSIGKSMGKMPAAVNTVWMGATVLFIVLAGTMLLGVWAGGAAVFFALYLILFGGAMFGTGHEMKKGTWSGMGLTDMFIGFVFPTWFSGAPFLVAALYIGVGMLYYTWKGM